MAFFKEACVINLRYRGNKNNHGTCCGILLDTRAGYVLAHASCLAPFMEQGILDLHNLTLNDLAKLDCEILLQEENLAEKERLVSTASDARLSSVQVSNLGLARGSTVSRSDKQSDRGTNEQLEKLNTTAGYHGQFYAYSKFLAEPIEFIQCQSVADSLDDLMPEASWELVDRKEQTKGIKTSTDSNNNSLAPRAAVEDMPRKLLSSFIVYKLKSWIPYPSQIRVRSTSQCGLGDRVEIVSTPFAGLKPDAFMNSLSGGVVSNVAGKKQCLLLSDARCILGGEGAPLYTFERGSASERCLTGIIMASLCWKSDEWVGFCVACDLGTVLDSLSPHLRHRHGNLSLQTNQSLSPKLLPSVQGLPGEEARVVMVKMGPTWGSGVVVDKEHNIILTCSHVVKDANTYPVQIKVPGKQALERVKVIYQQQPLKHQFDLAVLQGRAGHNTQQGSRVAVGVPTEGMEVVVVGHALFGPEHDLQPCVTSGVISKVISVNKVPVMVQTTCAVHPGASGGALLDTRGRLIGIVVCNAKDTTAGASFPHVNMSIPVCTVWTTVEKYIYTQDVSSLRALTIRNKLVDTIWSLGSAQDLADRHPKSKL